MDMSEYDSESASDIEFIRKKVLEGNWIHLRGSINALNDTLEYVPTDGKTFFPYSASIVMTTNPDVPTTGNLQDQVVAAFKVNSVIEDKAKIGISAELSASNDSGAGFGTDAKCPFDVKGLSLAGDGVKKIEIENILDGGSADAVLSGWIEDT